MSERDAGWDAVEEFLAEREADPAAQDSWENLLGEAMAANGESWAQVEAHTLSEFDLQRRFHTGFGRLCGSPFTLWTARYVYFPVQYDGRESVGFVSRHPSGEASRHWGGG